jgi:endonuclease I
MKKIFLLLCISFCTIYIYSQIPVGYYIPCNGKKGKALQMALHNIIKEHNQESYNELWTDFRMTDVKPDNTVWDMYSDRPNGSSAYIYNFGSDQCGNYSQEGDCYNREHSLPKSWFNDEMPMYTDLFHIYPTDGYVNGKRSNYPYGEVVNPTWISTNGSKLGNNSYSGYSGVVFEPIDEYKGDLARTYFYMATCYYDKNLSSDNGSAMFSGSQLKSWALEMLMEWHHNDPVSQKEITRNDAVYYIQNNRNPFIDYPQLVDKIFGIDSLNPFIIDDDTNIIINYRELHFSVFPNPTNGELQITTMLHERSKSLQEGDMIEIYDILGQLQLSIVNQKSKIQNIDVTTLAAGVYLLKIGNHIKKFVKM